MNRISFEKYQGTGNDFIILEDIPSLETAQIQRLCDRRFGIGADGLILMERGGALDFRMMYYNSDGSESFCGNGSRCGVRYALRHGWIGDSCRFASNDGDHSALIEGDTIKLHMHDVSSYEQVGKDFVMDTGSPHYLRFLALDGLDVVEEARAIRYSDRYSELGINVNFLEDEGDCLRIRTYERGVEDETLSCGTGVTAAALARHIQLARGEGQFVQPIGALGGDLTVEYTYRNGTFSDIYLCGPGEFVFSGSIALSPA